MRRHGIQVGDRKALEKAWYLYGICMVCNSWGQVKVNVKLFNIWVPEHTEIGKNSILHFGNKEAA